MALTPRPRAAAPAAPAKAAPAAAKAAVPAAKTVVQPAASKTELKSTTTTVTKTLLENGKIKGEPVIAESIEINPFVTATASTSIGIKFRKNMGNFEGAEISVHVSMPHYVEEAEQAAAQVSERARELLETQFAEFDFAQFKGEVVGGADFGVSDPEGDAAVVEEETAGELAEEEGGEMTADWVLEQDRETLEQIVTENELEIDPADYPDDDDLKSMIVGTLFPDEEGAAEEGAGDAATEEPATEDAGYTEEELSGATMDELKEVFKDWGMGPFPAYNAKTQAAQKKVAIKKIIAHQETMNAA